MVCSAKQDALRSLGVGGRSRRGFGMFYVYLLESEILPEQRYVGLTIDLKQRFAEHNARKSPHTSKFVPWRLVTYVAFTDQAKATAFEHYLKSGSGHAFDDLGIDEAPGADHVRPLPVRCDRADEPLVGCMLRRQRAPEARPFLTSNL